MAIAGPTMVFALMTYQDDMKIGIALGYILIIYVFISFARVRFLLINYLDPCWLLLSIRLSTLFTISKLFLS